MYQRLANDVDLEKEAELTHLEGPSGLEDADARQDPSCNA